MSMLTSGQKFRAICTLSASLAVLAGAAQAGGATPTHASPRTSGVVSMPLGARTAAPMGFLDFCNRVPEQCEATRNDNATDVRREASQLYWASVFTPAHRGVTRTAQPAAMRAGRPAREDWASIFGRPELAPALVNELAPERAPDRSNARSAVRLASSTERAAPQVRTVGLSARPFLGTSAPLATTEGFAAARNPLQRAFAFTAPVVRPQQVAFGVPKFSEHLLVTPQQRLADRLATGPVMAGSATAPTPAQSPSIPVETPFSAASAVVSVAVPYQPRPYQPRPYQPRLDQPRPDQSRPAIHADVVSADVAPARLPLDKRTWTLLNTINRGVNGRIRMASDESTFGVVDYWQSPTQAGAKGDCEDYVLAKRQALTQAGVPAAALSIAIVRTPWGETHAVLLVATESGEFVLDNLSEWISRWDRVDYAWQERQAPGKVFEWVRLAG